MIFDNSSLVRCLEIEQTVSWKQMLQSSTFVFLPPPMVEKSRFQLTWRNEFLETVLVMLASWPAYQQSSTLIILHLKKASTASYTKFTSNSSSHSFSHSFICSALGPRHPAIRLIIEDSPALLQLEMSGSASWQTDGHFGLSPGSLCCDGSRCETTGVGDAWVMLEWYDLSYS